MSIGNLHKRAFCENVTKKSEKQDAGFRESPH
jgi:hypothetical protein